MSKILKAVTVVVLVVTAASAAANTGVCKGCHGQKFEKKAMGKSKVVKDMSKKEIVKALKGYKAGTYGGVMKGLMKNQVDKYSNADLEEIAEAIKK